MAITPLIIYDEDAIARLVWLKRNHATACLCLFDRRSLSFSDLKVKHEDGATAYEPVPIICKCHCSRERISEVLNNFSAEEIADTVKDGQITVNCEFCSRSYVFDPAEFS